MYLKKLRISGFKSFDSPVSLDFSPGISAIVGPNGSGKSNITDAIRFVLGEQSTKTLRSSRMEEMIFQGSRNHPKKSACSVTLTMEDERPTEIERKLFRTGESVYRQNGKRVRLRDIQENFTDTGLGKNGYSMVSQGGIDQIVSASPEKLRAIIEEAVGIAGYQVKKAESQKNLEKTNLSLVRIEDILSEIEARLGPLKKKAETAKEYLRLYERLKAVELLLFLEIYETEKDKLDALEEDINLCEFHILDAKKRSEREDAIFVRLRNELSAKTDSQKDIDGKLRLLTDEKTILREEAIRDQAREESLTTQKAGNEKRRLEEEEKLKEALKVSDQTAKDYWDVKEQRAAVEEKLEATEREKEALMTKIRASEEAKELSLLEEQERLEAVARISEKRMASQTELSHMRGRLELLREQLKEEEALPDNEKLNRLQSEIEKTDLQITRAKQVYDQNEEAYQAYLTERSRLSRALSEKKQALEILRAKITYEQGLIENYSPYNPAVKFVMREPVEGVYGPVARLICMEEAYERAIETALGGKMQNIVVDRQRTAGRMIDALKRAHAGRAAFLPLDVLRQNRLSSRDEEKAGSLLGFIGVACDLVESEERFHPVLINLLGRTLVFSDFESASAARKSLPMQTIVTLDGEIFYPGGAVVGGSRKEKNSIFLTDHKLKALKETFLEEKGIYQTLKDSLVSLKAVPEANAQPHLALIEKKKRLISQFEAGEGEEEARQRALSVLKEEICHLTEDEKHLNKEISSLDQKVELLQPSEKTEKAFEDFTPQEKALDEVLMNLKIEAARLDESLRAYSERQASEYLRRQEIEERLNALHEADSEADQAILTMHAAASGRSARLSRIDDQEDVLRQEKAALEREISTLSERMKTSEEAIKSINLEYLHQIETKNKLDSEYQKISLHLNHEKEQIEEKYDLTPVMIYPIKDSLLSLGETIRPERKRELTEAIKALGYVSVSSIEEYEETGARAREMRERYDDLIQAKKAIEEVIRELDQSMEERFTKKFQALQEAFSEIFEKLFEGGSARLSLADPDHLLESGVLLSASPPGKKLTQLSLLSGGEKAMTAICLLLAFIRINPSPFVIIDEIDAALDDSNIIRFTNYLDGIRNENQFIMITHRKTTLRICERIYGVSMEDGVSRVLCVDPADYLED